MDRAAALGERQGKAAATAPLSPGLLASRVKQLAAELGFDLCGVARAGPIEDGGLDAFLAAGHEAGMAYLRRRVAERLDPRRIVPGARSVIAVAVSYFRREDEGDAPGERLRRVARYARGRDYHLFLRRRVRKLRRRLLELAPGARAHPSVDTSPVMEKVWAERAGLGWVGRNGLLIAPPFGSWVLLGAILTDAEIAADPPAAKRCGSCEACLPACPTGALLGDGHVDSRRCLSYWTIETREPIPEPLSLACADWTFGCDICQEVCPWNREARPSRLADFRPGPLVSLRCSELARLTPDRHAELVAGSPLSRPGFSGLRRNAALGLSREGGPAARAAAEELAADPDPAVAQAARWSRARLG